MTQRQELMKKIFPSFFQSLYFLHNTLKILKACLVSFHTQLSTPRISLSCHSSHGTFSFQPTSSTLVKLPQTKNITKILYNFHFQTLITMSSVRNMNHKWISCLLSLVIITIIPNNLNFRIILKHS